MVEYLFQPMMTLTQRETAFIIAVIRRAGYPKPKHSHLRWELQDLATVAYFFLLDDVNASWDAVERIAPEH